MRDFRNLPFNGYSLQLTRRRDESRAPFFLKILEFLAIAGLYNWIIASENLQNSKKFSKFGPNYRVLAICPSASLVNPIINRHQHQSHDADDRPTDPNRTNPRAMDVVVGGRPSTRRWKTFERAGTVGDARADARSRRDEAVVDVRRREEDRDDAGRRARGVRVETGREVSVR